MESIITKPTEYCDICGKRKATDTHHAIEGSNRMASDRHGLTLHICRECHTELHHSAVSESLSQMIGQLAFEKHEIEEGRDANSARNYFRNAFGRSYI